VAGLIAATATMVVFGGSTAATTIEVEPDIMHTVSARSSYTTSDQSKQNYHCWFFCMLLVLVSNNKLSVCVKCLSVITQFCYQ